MIVNVIEQILRQHFEPVYLQLIDESHKHVGHAGNMGGGHFYVHIVSAAFAGMSRLARFRLIQNALSSLYGSDIHALSIRAQTPEEFAA